MCNSGGGIGSAKSNFLAPTEGDNGPLAAIILVLCCVELLWAAEPVGASQEARWILQCNPSAAYKK